MTGNDASGGRPERVLKIAVAACCAAAVLVSILAWAPTTAVVVVVVALTTLQGLLLGGRRIVAVVIGLLVGAVAAGPAGALLRPMVVGATGQGGFLGEGLSFLTGAALVTVIVAVAASVGLSLLLRRLSDESRERIARADPFVGAGLGLLEGVLIAALLAWGIAAIRPIAEVQAEAARAPNARPNPVAERFVNATAGFEQTAVGRAATATNPVAGSEMLAIAHDLAVVSADPEARQVLADDPVFDEIRAMPEAARVLEGIDRDPALSALTADGIDPGDVAELLTSDRLLELVRESGMIGVVRPALPRVRAALDRALDVANANAERDQRP